MKVVLSEKARQDLTDIGDYIAKDSPARALAFVRALRSRVLGLADMPRAFSLIPRYEHYGIRRRPYRDYLIFYRVEDDHIAVIHVLHGARDYASLLFPPPPAP